MLISYLFDVFIDKILYYMILIILIKRDKKTMQKTEVFECKKTPVMLYNLK
jgi:hypothetical protein